MKLVLITFLFILYSCESTESSTVKKNSALSKEETLGIFEELILIESHLQNTFFSYENYREALFISRDSLLKSKNVTLEQFNQSFDSFAKSDKEMADLYEEVLNDFNEKSAKSN